MYNRLKSRKNKIEYRYAWWGREGTPQISALIKKIEPVCKNSSSTTARSVWKKVKKIEDDDLYLIYLLKMNA